MAQGVLGGKEPEIKKKNTLIIDNTEWIFNLYTTQCQAVEHNSDIEFESGLVIYAKNIYDVPDPLLFPLLCGTYHLLNTFQKPGIGKANLYSGNSCECVLFPWVRHLIFWVSVAITILADCPVVAGAGIHAAEILGH